MAHQTQEITITRMILASPAQVYAAFTQAEGWCEWCCEKAESDPHIGGKLHIYTEGYNAYGKFTGLEPDRAVAFTWDGDGEPPMLVQVLLDGHDHSTDMTFKVTILASEQDWPDFAETLARIWNRVLNNLKAVLEAKQA